MIKQTEAATREDNRNIAEKVLDMMLTHPGSPLHQLRDSETLTDADHLDAWFCAAEYAHIDVNWIRRIMGEDIGVDVFAFHLDLIHRVRERVEEILMEKLSNLSFIPRLEQYVRSFPTDERPWTRKIILAYLYQIYSGQSNGSSLLDLAKVFDIPRTVILSVNETHRLYQDGILEVEEGRFNREKPFHHRDLVLNTTVYSIFAGMLISEKELAIAATKPITRFFGLVSQSPDKAAEPLDTPTEQSADPDSEVGDIEDILKELEEEEERATIAPDEGDSAEEKSPGIEPAEDTLSRFEDDLDYFYSAFLWLYPLSKVRNEEADDEPIDQREQEQRICLYRRQYLKMRNVSQSRLRKSMDSGFIPRLERLAKRLKLREIEKDVLKVLVSARMFDTDRSTKNISGLAKPTISSILFLLIDDPRQRIREKRIFLRSGTLARGGLVHVEDRDDLQKQLLDCPVVLDNRLIEHLIGENYDVSDYVEGSRLYRPNTPLENVVLPGDDKQLVLDTIEGFPAFLRAKEQMHFSDVVEYGNALVMLFVGPSGTGKTMLANAVANHLDKKVLLFDSGTASQLRDHQLPQLFSLVFREARMNDSVLFFDESEELLSNRINDMLIELEKHEGIVIFATNASFRVDEAMRRRINLIVNFQEPGPALRKKIWDIHLPRKALQTDALDLETLAQTFELNGGLIRNAVFSALARSVRRAKSCCPRMTLEDLRHGASEQLRNKLFMSDLQEARVPQRGLESVVADDETMDTLREIVGHAKARKVLETEWGFQNLYPDHNGLSVLLHGPPGTGKTYTAEALAYEIGRTLKVVNYANVLSMWVGGTEKALEALFREVADSESVLLFDEADALFAARSPVRGALDRYANVETDLLLRLIEQHNTVAILTTNKRENLDPAFFRRMHYTVEFDRPDEPRRLNLWQKLVPQRMPLADDVDYQNLARRFAFTGAEIRATIVGAATKQALRTDRSRVVTMADMIQAGERVERNQEPGRSRTVGF